MIWRITIVILLCFLGVGAAFHESHTPEQFHNDVLPLVSYERVTQNSTMASQAFNANLSYPARVIYKYADFMMFTVLEGSRYFMEYGYEHPQYNYLFMAKVVIWLMILSAAVPLLYVVVFLWYVIGEGFKALKRFKEKRGGRLSVEEKGGPL